jgi:outer membrane protein assembly factor BamE (lipoprotein component of BamABCDE complex)
MTKNKDTVMNSAHCKQTSWYYLWHLHEKNTQNKSKKKKKNALAVHTALNNILQTTGYDS